MPELIKAVFKPQINGYDEVTVHFNPSSLQYDVQNTLKQGRGNSKKQYVSQSTAKLSMELIFDTTQTGIDVRIETLKVAKFLKPGSDKIPPIVKFEWGTFIFQGMFDSFKEKVDFFSIDGVPLRSTVNISMSAQDEVFSPEGGGQQSDGGAMEAPPSSPHQVAQQGGDGRAGREIAAANNQDSIRFGSGASLAVGGEIELKGPAAFASAGAGFGLDVGGGLGLDAGAGIGLEASAGISAGLSASANLEAGVSLDAGAAVSAGASSLAQFGDLHTKTTAVSTNFNSENLLPENPIASLSTDAGASFSLGGQANVEGGTGLKADVGVDASLTASIKFDD